MAFDEAIWVDFENAKLPIPKEYDKYLKYLYGDYMEMIPVSERHVSHDIKQIDLRENMQDMSAKTVLQSLKNNSKLHY